MEEKLRWFKFYPRDFLLSQKVQAMTAEEVGWYILLLCHQWLEGLVPAKVDQIATICRTIPANISKSGANISKTRNLILSCFPLTSNRRCRKNLKLESIREEMLQRFQDLREAGRKGGIATAQLQHGSSDATAQLQPSSSDRSDRSDRLDRKDLKSPEGVSHSLSEPEKPKKPKTQKTPRSESPPAAAASDIGFKPPHRSLLAEVLNTVTIHSTVEPVDSADVPDELPSTEPTAAERERAKILAAQADLLKRHGPPL